MVKNTILLKLTNMTPFLRQFHSIYPPSKLSRASFTSASKYLTQNQHSREDAGGEEDAKKVAARIREARQVYEKEKDEEAEDIAREYKEMKDKAKDTAHNVKEKAKETAKGAWENAKGATQNVKETIVGKD
ncbi:hypothetical protein vseg_017479 [Gypsophila vaccaria]